jgi:hypothetical protein
VGHQSHCSFNLPTQPSNPLDSSQQSYDANKRPSSITEEEEETCKSNQSIFQRNKKYRSPGTEFSRPMRPCRLKIEKHVYGIKVTMHNRSLFAKVKQREKQTTKAKQIKILRYISKAPIRQIIISKSNEPVTWTRVPKKEQG